MKTICFVVPNFPTVTETFVTNHVLQAQKKGYAVIILTKRLFSINESSQKDLLQEHQILKYTYEIDYNIPRHKFKKLIKSIFLIIKYLRYWLRVRNVSLKKRFSMLPYKLHFYNRFNYVSAFHVQFAYAGIDIADMKSIGLLNNKIITTFHGHDAHFKNKNDLKRLRGKYKTLLKYSNYLTVNTLYLSNKIKVLGGNLSKLHVIPMGIDIDFFQTKKLKTLTSNTTVKLISIGRLIELKGFEYAIKSIKLIVDRGFKIEYIIAGEGELKNKLLQLISKLDLTESVFLVGNKSQNEIKKLLNESHIFLMSSITDIVNRAEAQGVVTAEAQAMGLPIVAFDCGGVKFTILNEETGYLVKEKNIDDYADVIIKLINDNELYSNMSVAAKCFVRNNFSRAQLMNKFIKLYE